MTPLTGFFNRTTWMLYDILKPRKDRPIIAANVPGIFLEATACLTTLIH